MHVAGVKLCTSCHRKKSLDRFYTAGRHKGGGLRYHSHCKTCKLANEAAHRMQPRKGSQEVDMSEATAGKACLDCLTVVTSHFRAAVSRTWSAFGEYAYAFNLMSAAGILSACCSCQVCQRIFVPSSSLDRQPQLYSSSSRHHACLSRSSRTYQPLVPCLASLALSRYKAC